MAPRDHRIHLGRMDCLETSPKNNSLTKLSFSGPQNHAKNIPGPKCRPRGSKIRPRPPKSVPGHEKTTDARRKTMQNPALEKIKRSHIAQVMAKNHFGGTSQNPDVCKGRFDRKIIFYCKKSMKMEKNKTIPFALWRGKVHFA